MLETRWPFVQIIAYGQWFDKMVISTQGHQIAKPGHLVCNFTGKQNTPIQNNLIKDKNIAFRITKLKN